MISESPIRIIQPDIRYPTDIAHIVFESDIRIKYPNSYSISEKTSGYPKIISESLSDPSRSVGRSENIRTIYTLLITCVRITWAIGPLCNFTRYYVSSILRPAISHRRPFCKLAKKQAT